MPHMGSMNTRKEDINLKYSCKKCGHAAAHIVCMNTHNEDIYSCKRCGHAAARMVQGVH